MLFLRRLAYQLPAVAAFICLLLVGKLLVLAVSAAIQAVQNLPPSSLPQDETTNWILGIVIVFGLGPIAIAFYYAIEILSHFSLFILPFALTFDLVLRKRSAIYFPFPPILLIGAIAWSPALRAWQII